MIQHQVHAFCAYLIVTSVLVFTGCPERGAGQRNAAELVRTAQGTSIPFQIDVNTVELGGGEYVGKAPADSGIRFITGYLEPRHFNERDLRALFSQLAARYGDAAILSVAAYGDREMLRRASNNLLHPPPGDIDPNRVKSQAYRRWAEANMPAKWGYFWADYRLDVKGNSERIDYSPEPSSEQVKTIWLKG
ncbi:MAG: hypothetical protein ACREDR_12205 [Blastocatellia bacterium]